MTREVADGPADGSPLGVEIPVIVAEGFRCFACSPRHEHGLRLRMWHADGVLTTETRFSADFASYPGVVHGGVVATAADELMANLILVERELLTFTTTLRMRYLRPLAVDSLCRIVARITAVGPDSIAVEADVLAEDGVPSAMATASYQPIRTAHARDAFDLSPDDHDRMRPFLAESRP